MIWKLLPSYDDRKRWGLILFVIIIIPMAAIVPCSVYLITKYAQHSDGSTVSEAVRIIEKETTDKMICILVISSMIMLIVLLVFIYLRCECKERLYRHLEGNAGMYQDVYSLAPDDFLAKQYSIVGRQVLGSTFLSEAEMARCEAIMMVRRIRKRDEHEVSEEDSSVENDRE